MPPASARRLHLPLLLIKIEIKPKINYCFKQLNHIFKPLNSLIMNNYSNFLLLNRQVYVDLSRFFFLSLLIFFTSLQLSLSAQKGEIDSKLTDCLDEQEYTFTGVPEKTLCEDYSDFNCQIEIGEGTQYPQSSLLSSSISGNVCVVGDFEINSAFTFLNAIVKINSGVTISVSGNSTGFSESSTLYINNSKMFSCNNMWNGITLGEYSRIFTSNNSIIEDAEKAIFASGLTRLFIGLIFRFKTSHFSAINLFC